MQLVWVVPLVLGAAILSFAMSRTSLELVDTPADVRPDWDPVLRSLYFLVPPVLLAGVLSLLASLATLHLVVQAAVGTPPSVRVAPLTARPRVLAYLGWGFLGGLLTLLAYFCCLLPGYLEPFSTAYLV